LHNTDIDDPNIALSLRDSMIEGFMEDKVIIEDQQLLLDMNPDFKMHGIQADAALAHFRRTLDKMIARESEAELS
ncbi:MAG: aromatic ring-hydroxylating dioxygenase subunit alpha, partial [Gammaproteobacteria bacterium]|nr:aromatic ring-hydroxylating dioxygenase subunit alpha [Gammaproteobacteria bacterium]